jgi:hypothetical protein
LPLLCSVISRSFRINQFPPPCLGAAVMLFEYFYW